MTVRMGLTAWLLAFGVSASLTAETFVPSQLKPPAPRREFRGVWVASVSNIDWPSNPGFPTAQQKAELLAIIDRAASLRLNAIILQVRPACDALYASKLEPWSEYLTGQQGRAPEPFWDPLATAVEEAHQRGLELHAWFNPYRARHRSATGPLAPTHIRNTQPALVKTYGDQLWLDPGEAAVREHSLRVILDVVRRYDVDGVHMDDYFYPYREKDSQGNEIGFPDDASWQRYISHGGKLERDDWRRDNVNQFIRQVNEAVHAAKPWVKFGLSPFGIWRPGYPPQVQGFDQYAKLYADARLWLNEGWLDYFAPQLYWPREPAAQSFTALLAWWTAENTRQRHLWPGLNTAKAATWKAEEIVAQVRLAREGAIGGGAVHWNMSTLLNDRGGVAQALKAAVYTETALVPASPWLDRIPPAKPRIFVEVSPAQRVTVVRWQQAAAEVSTRWVLQTRRNATWTLQVLPARTSLWSVGSDQLPEVVALYALDRAGNLSEPAVSEHR